MLHRVELIHHLVCFGLQAGSLAHSQLALSVCAFALMGFLAFEDSPFDECIVSAPQRIETTLRAIDHQRIERAFVRAQDRVTAIYKCFGIAEEIDEAGVGGNERKLHGGSEGTARIEELLAGGLRAGVLDVHLGGADGFGFLLHEAMLELGYLDLIGVSSGGDDQEVTEVVQESD